MADNILYSGSPIDAEVYDVTIIKGDKGDKGDLGPTPVFSIGEVTTLEYDQPASANISGTAEQPVLNLGIPVGKDAYTQAVEGGYTGGEAEFNSDLANFKTYTTTAESAKGSAETAATNAAASASAAAASATAAAGSASDAADDADRAEQATSDASGYATNAAASASSAASSAGTATTKAGEAAQSATAASQSASSASSSATAASGSASAAAGSATNASNSATSAATSATAANTAKTAAETAQGKAEDAQDAAETAASSVSASAAQIATNTSDIADLKSALENGGLLITQSGLVQGSYNSAGAVVSNQNRIRNTGFLSVEKGGIIHFDPGETVTSIFYGRFAADKSFIGDGPNWLSGDITVDWDGYAIVTYKNATNTALSVADYDATTVIMTAAEAAKFGKEIAVSSFISAVNPMNPLLFDKMCFRKGRSTSGTEYITEYADPQFVNDDFSDLNSATASSGTSGYLAFRFNDTNKPNVLTSGETLSLFLVAKTNKSMTFVPRLSTSTTWAPAYSTAVANDIALSPGYNCIKLEFAFDHSGTDGRTEYRFFVLEGNTVYSDLDAEFSLVRDDSFLGWVKEIAASNSAVYDTDLLFWGDSLTAGAGGTNYSYPKKCSEILGLSRINAGVGGETANTIAARQGGNNIIIPAGAVNGTYALDDLTDIFGYHVNPLRQGNGAGSGNKIIVNGYECTLSISQTSSASADATYTISGYTGPTLTVPTFARFAGSDFTGKVVVIFVGQNGASFTGLSGVDARIAIIDSMIKHIGHERYVILGLTSGTDSSRETDDNQMLAHYGNKFFPTRKLLVDYGLTINGLTPTAQDTADIAAGTVPSSLRSDGTHMNDYGYIAIGTMLADKIRSLGYV